MLIILLFYGLLLISFSNAKIENFFSLSIGKAKIKIYIAIKMSYSCVWWRRKFYQS